MRKKRVELYEAVVVAARRAVQTEAAFQSLPVDIALGVAQALDQDATTATDDLIAAVAALDAYEAGVIDGRAPWAGESDTSRDAAMLATILQRSTRHAIVGQLANVAAFAHPGYTDDQLERRLHGKHQTISSARNWLVNHGWVRDSGVRRMNLSSKRQAAVWELTPAAWHKLKGGA